MTPLFRTALFGGAGAALASLAAISFLARREGHAAVRPINATSHVLWGPRDATRDEIDVAHSLSGALINIGSAFFWGSLYAIALAGGRKPPGGGKLVGGAFLTSALAALADYGLMPRRLRPGWELAIAPGSVAMAFAAMGVGLAAGGFAARAAGAPHRCRRAT
jgi:hypothetical protein